MRKFLVAAILSAGIPMLGGCVVDHDDDDASAKPAVIEREVVREQPTVIEKESSAPAKVEVHNHAN